MAIKKTHLLQTAVGILAMVALSACAAPPWLRGDRTPAAAVADVTAAAGQNFFAGQTEGLAAVVRELDAIARLVEIVRQLPPERGELTVNFAQIQADLAAVRAGLMEAVQQPTTAPRTYEPLSTQYLD